MAIKNKFILIIFSIIIIGFFLLALNYKNSDISITIPQESKINQLSDEELKEKIGQMILIGFRGLEASEDSEIYKIIKEVKVGGVVLSDYDVPSKSYPRNIKSETQVKKLISDIQNYSDNTLFVAVDAEGGNVNRLKKFINIPSAEEMAKSKTTEIEAEKIAKKLKDLGFNMNLAPVVDVNINPDNPIIGKLGRSFSSDANVVTDNAKEFIKKHLENNIITVLKHFSGHGSSKSDSHLGFVDVTNTYKEEELLPYKRLEEEGLLKVVMTAHITNKNIDENYPATLSPNFLQKILREQIGFKGVIISDDMQMSAISKNYGFEESIVRAINAGCDILCISNNSPDGYDKDIAYRARDAIFNAVKEGKIKEERIIESYNRIIELKKEFKLFDKEAGQI